MIADLIADLGARGVSFRLHGDRLKVSAPPGVLTPEVRERIREHMEELLAFMRAAAGDADLAPEIRRVGREHGAPLGLVQQRMWMLDRLEPGTTVYNLPGAWRLTGLLNVEAFLRAFREVIRRHEVTRVAIGWRGDAPVQRVATDTTVPVPLDDLQHLPKDAREPELMRRMEAQRDELFDLGNAPLLRARLYRLDEQNHVFLLVPHHVIWDGWSWDILLAELDALYTAFAADSPTPLPELTAQYIDVAGWHREWMRGPELQRQMAYWRDKLAGPLPLLKLPTDRPRPQMLSQRGVRRLINLDPAVTGPLRAIARAESATLFMALLAAYKVLLHRFTDQSDLLVGAPVQDRLHPEAQGLIGVFVNTLVLRTSITPDLTFLDVLRRVREVCIGAYAHQDVPFEHIVEELQPERSLSHTPLFQTLFTFQDITNRPTALGDLKLTQVHVPTHDAPTDVLLGIMVDRSRVLGVFDFHADLFEPPTMNRFVSAFQTLLADLVEFPDRAIGTLRVLPPDERVRIIETFNATERPVPSASTVDSLIAAQIARNASRPAVRCATVSWTYADLDREAASMAARLTAAGIVAGDLVAVCVERSAAMLAALLGVWRIGAAWVPLDPEYPPDRLTWVLQHSAARGLIVTDTTDGAVPSGPIVRLNLDHPDPPAMGEHPRVPGDGSQLAYVLYTSGSTGQPKGVQIPHSAVVNFLSAMADRPGCGGDDRLLAVTTLAFDIAVLELFLPLTVGAEVIVANADVARDGPRLSTLIDRVRPTIMQATPSTWRMLLDAGWGGSGHLRALCGGEGLPATLAAELLARVPELWNMYGPTETTIWSTCGPVRAGESRITIGRPIDNTRVYVLDERQEPVPIGIPGEAWIGGAGVTTGYLHDPALTADRVRPDPVHGERHGTAYRTGDLVRWLDDGRLEHLGRLDRQMKIRGHRIEPGEIETALESLDEVRQGVVVARGADVDRRLVAYIVFADGQRLTSTELRRRLATHLPAYLIPGLLVPLDAIPLTPNGKLDTSALPDPLARATRNNRRRTPPATARERDIAAIWSELLGEQSVAKDDNFFELGGHSLQSIRAVALIQERLGLKVDPRAFFFQTLEQIADGAAQDVSGAGRLAP